jgi:hypothetical protein
MYRASFVIFATTTNKTDFSFGARFDVAKTFVSMQKGFIVMDPDYNAHGVDAAPVQLLRRFPFCSNVIVVRFFGGGGTSGART